MNNYVVIILVMVVFIGLVCLMVKNNTIKQLNKALKQQNTDGVRSYLTKKASCVFLSMYVRDLYEAKTYLLDQNNAKLKEHLSLMFAKKYDVNESKEYLTLYYHIFLQRGDPFMDVLLVQIEQHSDVHFVQYCKWSKAVLIEGKNDVISDMEKAIEDKQYTAFPLGVVVYLIGIQNKRLGNMKAAIEWLETALEVLQPNDLYVQEVSNEVALLLQQKKEIDTEA